MSTRKWLWRAAGLTGLIYCAYIALVAYVVGTLSVELFGVFDQPGGDPLLVWAVLLVGPSMTGMLLLAGGQRTAASLAT